MLPVVIGHLTFGIRLQDRIVTLLEILYRFGCQNKGKRQELPGFIRGIAKHHTLIASALLINALRDVCRLL